METPFPFEPLLLFGFMAIMLLVGMFLRAKFRFFQKYLIPSCFLGGTIGLILISTGVVDASIDLLESYAFHLFIISFIWSSPILSVKSRPRIKRHCHLFLDPLR